jgi:MFS family permease
MKNDYVPVEIDSREVENENLLNKGNSDDPAKGTLHCLQSIIDKEGLKSFQYFTAFALGLITFINGIYSYEFNFIYPSIIKFQSISSVLKELLNTSFAFGDMIGAFTCQYFAKYFGRSNSIIMFSAVLMINSCIISVFSNIWWLSLCRLIGGISIGINYCLIVPTLTEFLPTKFREIITITFLSFFRVGIIVYVLVDRIFAIGQKNMMSYLQTEKNEIWRYALYLPAVISILLFITNIFSVKETPRYLFLNSRNKEAVREIKRIYRRHLKSIEEDKLVKEGKEFSEQSKFQAKFVDLFSGNFIRQTLLTSAILLCSNICTTSNTYSLPLILNFNISSFWEYIIIQQTVAVIAHIPAILLSRNEKIGRKYTIMIGFFGTALISIVTLAISNGVEITSPIMFLFMILFGPTAKLYVAEAFPTKLRVEAISLSFSLARLGDFLSFLLCGMMHSFFNYGPMLVIFISAIIGGTCTLLLKVETSNVALDTRM